MKKHTDEETCGGSFLEDPRMMECYLSKTPKERREMADYFHSSNLFRNRPMTAKERQKLYDDYFAWEEGGEIAGGCVGCIFVIVLLVVAISAWIKGA